MAISLVDPSRMRCSSFVSLPHPARRPLSVSADSAFAYSQLSILTCDSRLFSSTQHHQLKGFRLPPRPRRRASYRFPVCCSGPIPISTNHPAGNDRDRLAPQIHARRTPRPLAHHMCVLAALGNLSPLSACRFRSSSQRYANSASKIFARLFCSFGNLHAPVFFEDFFSYRPILQRNFSSPVPNRRASTATLHDLTRDHFGNPGSRRQAVSSCTPNFSVAKARNSTPIDVESR
ncbi:hypothetical protein C8Q79DRAFT_416407 [Trametes meyenii]|nr:hypothetical protein C8Q79DRAFT_416407 [Trametes meyenii]